MKYIQRKLLLLFVRSADDIVSFLDNVEQRIRELAVKADEQANKIDDDARALAKLASDVRANARKAYTLADRISGNADGARSI